jgi:ATP-dependent protease ClpP protease subunit
MPIDNVDLPLLNTSNIYERPIARIFDLYLTGEITESEKYIEWYQLLQHATPFDTIYIHINSPGGYVDTTVQLMSAMRRCQGLIVASVEGFCMSGATMIFLTAHQHEIDDHSAFMFHTYSGANFGKGPDIFAAVTHDAQWIRNMMNDVYDSFMTPEEIESMLDGKDYWMNKGEVITRLDRFIKRREEKEKAQKEKSSLELIVDTDKPVKTTTAKAPVKKRATRTRK